LHCEVLSDLADLLLLLERPAEAIATLETALALHERKGATGYAERTRARISELSGSH
jgi:hypothetical protein